MAGSHHIRTSNYPFSCRYTLEELGQERRYTVEGARRLSLTNDGFVSPRNPVR